MLSDFNILKLNPLENGLDSFENKKIRKSSKKESKK